MISISSEPTQQAQPAADDSDARSAARHALANEHVQVLRTTLPASLLATIVVAAVLWFHSNQFAVATTTLLVVLLGGASMWMLGRAQSTAKHRSIDRLLTLIQLTGGVGWGLFFLVPVPHSANAQIFVAMVIPIAMALNAMETVASQRSFFAFHIPFSVLSLVAVGYRFDELPAIATIAVAIAAALFAVSARTLTSTSLDHATLAVQNSSLTARLQALNDDLEHRSTHDTLTGLPNRLAIDRRLSKAMERANEKPVTALFIDLDGFKEVNDSMGHDVGDELLVTVARRFAGVVSPDALLGRLGGDEMIVLLDGDEGRDSVPRLTNLLFEALATPIVLASTTFNIEASIGVATTSPACQTGRDLLRFADIALYQAKARGGNQWVPYKPDPTQNRSPIKSGADKRHVDANLS